MVWYSSNPTGEKGKLMMSEKALVIAKAFYILGGKGSSKQVFDVITAEDKETFRIRHPEDIMWYVTVNQRKGCYFARTDEKGEKYMDFFGGKYRKVYAIKQRVIDFLEKYHAVK